MSLRATDGSQLQFASYSAVTTLKERIVATKKSKKSSSTGKTKKPKQVRSYSPTSREEATARTEMPRGATKPRRKSTPGKLEQVRTRGKVIQDLAEGQITRAKIAEKYNVAEDSIYAFQRRHRLEIQQIRDRILGDINDIYLTDKRARIQQYADDIAMTKGWEIGPVFDKDSNVIAREMNVSLIRQRQQLVRAIADELGDIPRQTVNDGGVTDRIEIEFVGIDPTDII